MRFVSPPSSMREDAEVGGGEAGDGEGVGGFGVAMVGGALLMVMELVPLTLPLAASMTALPVP